MTSRFFYSVAVIIVIALGILSRKIDGIPLFVGDLLYAMMIYAMARIAFRKTTAAIVALLVCFVIEFSQLLQLEWLVAMRHTTLGHYVLGQGFLWSDLLAYTAGITIAFLTDLLYSKKTGTNSSGL